MKVRGVWIRQPKYRGGDIARMIERLTESILTNPIFLIVWVILVAASLVVLVRV